LVQPIRSRFFYHHEPKGRILFLFGEEGWMSKFWAITWFYNVLKLPPTKSRGSKCLCKTSDQAKINEYF